MAVQAVKNREPEPKKELGLDSLTAAETAMAEQQAHQSITTLGSEGYPQAGLIGALGWALARRGNPKLSYVEYMASRKLSDITRELGLVDDEAGTPEEEEGKGDELTLSS